MAKVLITPIGTGRRTSDRGYPTAKYKFQDNDKIYETSFVSSALAEHLEVDKIIFIGTAKSMWEEIYRYFTDNIGENVDDDYWIEIAESSSSSGYNKKLVNEKTLKNTMISVDNYLKSINSKSTGGSLPLIIDYGLDENELWKRFSAFITLTEILNNRD